MGSFFLSYDIKSSDETKSSKAAAGINEERRHAIIIELHRQIRDHHQIFRLSADKTASEKAAGGIDEERHISMIAEMQRQAKVHYSVACKLQPRLMNIVNLTHYYLQIIDQAHQYIQIQGKQAAPFIGGRVKPGNSVFLDALTYQEEPLLKYDFQFLDPRPSFISQTITCTIKAHESSGKQTICADFESIHSRQKKILKSLDVLEDWPYFNIIFDINPINHKPRIRLEQFPK
jgi:hypothetical protein